MLPQHGTLELSHSRVRHNLSLLRNKIGPNPKFCPTLKANAYGHGTRELAAMLSHDADIPWLCVYSLPEAADLDELPQAGNILVLAPLVLTEASPLLPELATPLLHRIRLNITDSVSARLLSKFASSHNMPAVHVHIQIDAGLTRIGVDPEKAADLAIKVASLPGLKLEGLFAHFSHGDVPGHNTLEQQLSLLHQITAPLKQKFPHLIFHLQNSGGSWHTDTANLDLVRIGIALYGLQPSTTHPIAGLQPIAQLTAPILALHDRPPNTGVGYGHTYTTTRPSRLAVVPVGYADGYPRQLSNTKNAIAQIRDIDVPVVGRVSMDQIILDITDLPTEGDLAPQLGDIVTVISSNPTKPNSLDQMADAIGTIGYELATHFGPRLRRVIVD